MSDDTFLRHRRCLKLLLFSCFVSLIFPCKSDDVQFLMQFKSSLQYSNSPVLDTWKLENPMCNFSGIVCDSNQMVKEINLAGQNLSGTVSFDSICSLQSLEKLSLGSNYLHGGISDHISNCTRLQLLDLGCNHFSGEVPNFSSLTQLTFFNLNKSGISGQFPWKSLENLTNLTFLSLGDNHLDASLFPLEVLKLDKLYWLYLTNCSLEGQIPEGIGNLTLLENLELSDNYLTGKIPDGIIKLTKLHQLELYNNRLSGKLPEGFGNLTALVNFDASTNHLEGEITELRTLTNLKSLQLFENHLSGEVPAEIGDFKNLQEFSIYTNKFTGELPQKIGSWADFIYIDVSENFLSGPIPPDMCKNGKLTDLLLLQNKFTGALPDTYASCLSLIRLRVSINSLSGHVPSGIWGLPKIDIIDLTLNQFEGSVTPYIGDAKSLAQLFLANNRFSGELPGRISEASSLVSINLGFNQFAGELPAGIGELKSLYSLHLESNLFSGPMPESLGSCVSLNDVNLAGNAFSGEIPTSLGSLPSLNSLNLSDNDLSGQIPDSLSSLKLSLLDLSNNRLVGKIPDSLAVHASHGSFAANPGLCSQSIQNFKPCSSVPVHSREIRTLVYCLLAGAVILIVSLTWFLYLKCSWNSRDLPIKRGASWDMKQFHVLSFTEDQVVKAVRQENLIGKGGSGSVYKIALDNGKSLAVKHIWKSDSGGWRSYRSSSAMLTEGKGRSTEYDAEVATLSSIRHVNVVKLYCSITSEDSHLLVYEYLPNGSLWDWLHGCQKIKIDWLIRYEIAIGAAKGLEYLHHGCDRPVIHRDVKCSNILLDEDMKPKIADFGLAKFLQASSLRESTHIIAGTYGYIAPEYAYTSKVNRKSDVYSFGVVLIELVTGKKAVEPEFGENNDIVQWACNKVKNSCNFIDLVDSNISVALREDAVKVLRIGLKCTARIPALRPSMRTVVQMLEEAEPCKLTEIVVNAERSCNKDTELP